jgi:septal ring factor EnvC (AmiA/AmiB activator)
MNAFEQMKVELEGKRNTIKAKQKQIEALKSDINELESSIGKLNEECLRYEHVIKATEEPLEVIK